MVSDHRSTPIQDLTYEILNSCDETIRPYTFVGFYAKLLQTNFDSSHSDIIKFCKLSFQILTVIIAIIIPNLGPFITLTGAVCLSTLGLMFPAIIETITYWDRPGMGRFNWRLIKNGLLVIFGIIGFLTGTYVSIEEITETFFN